MQRAGLHLGNWGEDIPGSTRDLIVQSKANALLAMQNIKPENLRFWAEQNPNGYFISRFHYDAHGQMASYPQVVNWANGQVELIDSYLKIPEFRTIYDNDRFGVKVFNEPNFVFEGFGTSEEAMKVYNEMFMVAAKYIKDRFPKAKTIGYSLAPGNKDAFFKSDRTNEHYFLHGPEAAKENPTEKEIKAAIQSCLTREAQNHMDWFGCHVYPHPGTWNEYHLGRRFTQYWKFLPEKLVNNTFILECSVADEAGQAVRANETNEWLWMLNRDYPQVKAITMWWAGAGDPTWERHFFTERDGGFRPVCYTLITYNNHVSTTPPQAPVSPVKPPPVPEPGKGNPGDSGGSEKPTKRELSLPEWVNFVPAEVGPNQEYWRITKAYMDDSNSGLHHIFVHEPHDKNVVCVITNTGNNAEHKIALDKPVTEEALNFAMWRHTDGNNYNLKFDGLPSDKLENLRLEGNHHISYRIWVEKAVNKVEAPKPPKPPVITPPVKPTKPGEFPMDELRNVAWNIIGIAYNKQAGIFKYAQEHKLGRPVTNEFHSKTSNGKSYVVQGYDKAIVTVELKNGQVDMATIRHLDWI